MENRGSKPKFLKLVIFICVLFLGFILLELIDLNSFIIDNNSLYFSVVSPIVIYKNSDFDKLAMSIKDAEGTDQRSV